MHTRAHGRGRAGHPGQPPAECPIRASPVGRLPDGSIGGKEGMEERATHPRPSRHCGGRSPASLFLNCAGVWGRTRRSRPSVVSGHAAWDTSGGGGGGDTFCSRDGLARHGRRLAAAPRGSRWEGGENGPVGGRNKLCRCRGCQGSRPPHILPHGRLPPLQPLIIKEREIQVGTYQSQHTPGRNPPSDPRSTRPTGLTPLRHRGHRPPSRKGRRPCRCPRQTPPSSERPHPPPPRRPPRAAYDLFGARCAH